MEQNNGTFYGTVKAFIYPGLDRSYGNLPRTGAKIQIDLPELGLGRVLVHLKLQ